MDEQTAGRFLLLGFYLVGLMAALLVLALPSEVRNVLLGAALGLGGYLGVMWFLRARRRVTRP